ncbi:protein-tyrosine-phosphatase [Limibacter armeniacum]|uniref:arsenate-mycothiol transferase ArsC n=1 Tax=Limibacter armeniacum TaxID=466084 RepID=UPI002FE56F47
MKRIVLILSMTTMLFSCNQQTENKENITESQEATLGNTKSQVTSESSQKGTEFHAEINAYIEDAIKGFDSIDEKRKKQLKKLALYIRSKSNAGEDAKIIYICTHNSRRSHMSQLWGMVAADYYGVNAVTTYSGGTEATAFNPRSVACLKRAGFKIEPKTEGDNPVYSVSYGDHKPLVEAFSKKYTHESNPQKNFAAVMTCSHADKNCPTVAGASMRLAIPYVDPKVSDNTPQEAATYDERCKQIATEEFYLFSQVKG